MSVAGIVFLGTPHQGSDVAGYVKSLARVTGRDTTLLDSLTRNSQVLHEIAQDFEVSYSNADLVCFYEGKHNHLGFKVRRAYPCFSSPIASQPLHFTGCELSVGFFEQQKVHVSHNRSLWPEQISWVRG